MPTRHELAASSGTCPDDAVLAEVLAASHDDRWPALERHLADCAACQFTVRAAQAVAPAAPRPLEQRLGRFVLRQRLGEGATGEVYEAVDLDLTRRVAIKILRAPHRDDARARARLVREAQALAKVVHPSIATIYDVTEIDGQLLIAMEIVHGHSLTRWLAGAPRTWREIVAVFAKAAAALAAAHDEAVIHRDFKPDNVVVGDDGTVKVIDFGLALVPDDIEGSAPPDAGAPNDDGSDDLTVTRARTRNHGRVGTPAYMAPEVLAGTRANAASDQFSFAVALHEALAGERPFRASSVEDLVSAHGRAASRLPAAIPAWLRRVVQRGLARQPGQRAPSMHDVAHDLTQGLGRRRRRLVGALGAAALALAALGVLHAVTPPARPLVPLAGLWDPPARARVAAAFAGLGSTGALMWPRSEATIDHAADRYLRTLDAIATDPTEVADLRRACLEHRRAEFAAVVHALSQPQAPRTPDLFLDLLGRVEDCLDAARLAAMPKRPPVSEASLGALLDELARAEALFAERQDDAGMALTRRVAAEARELGAYPVLAQAMLRIGHIMVNRGRPVEAEQALAEALSAAELTGDDTARVSTLTAWMYLHIHLTHDLGAAQVLSQLAESSLESSRTQPQLRALVRRAQGTLFLARGEIHAASLALREAYDQAVLTWGADAPQVASYLTKLLQVSEFSGNATWVERVAKDTVAALGSALGEGHPAVLRVLISLGALQKSRALYGSAIVTLRAAERLTHAIGGDPTHEELVVALALVDALLARDRDAEAAEVLRPLLLKADLLQVGHRGELARLELMGATLALAEGRADAALALTHAAVDRLPGDDAIEPQARMLQITALIQQGRRLEASWLVGVAMLAMEHKRGPHTARDLLHLARAAAALGDAASLRRALFALRDVARTTPGFFDDVWLAGASLAAAPHDDAALACELARAAGPVPWATWWYVAHAELGCHTRR